MPSPSQTFRTTPAVVRILLGPQGHGREHRVDVGLVVGLEAEMLRAGGQLHVDARADGGGADHTDLLPLHRPHLLHVAPVLGRVDAEAFQPQAPHTVFSDYVQAHY